MGAQLPKLIDIKVRWHRVPPGGDAWWDWWLTVDGVSASGRGPTHRSALRRARRRLRRLQRMRATVDIASLVDAATEDAR
jgi:hypothetical protein